MKDNLSALEAAIFWSKKQNKLKDVQVFGIKRIEEVLELFMEETKDNIDYRETSLDNVYEIFYYGEERVEWSIRVFLD
jgi:predicted ATP-dependent protease